MAPTVATAEAFRKNVRQEVLGQQSYVASQLRRYRYARIMVIVSAALVPVLTPIDAVPKWVLGLLGAIAAVTESLNQLYRWRDSAVAAQRHANAMEAQLNLFQTRTTPYDADLATALSRFVTRIELIRTRSSDAFVGIWAEDKPPSAEAPPDSPPADEAAGRADGPEGPLPPPPGHPGGPPPPSQP